MIKSRVDFVNTCDGPRQSFWNAVLKRANTKSQSASQDLAISLLQTLYHLGKLYITNTAPLHLRHEAGLLGKYLAFIWKNVITENSF